MFFVKSQQANYYGCMSKTNKNYYFYLLKANNYCYLPTTIIASTFVLS